MKNSLLLLLMAPCLLWAQNLVPNPGFEANSGCPSRRAQWYFAADWTNGTARVNNGRGNTNGTPDYFNTCGSGTFAPPSTYYAILSPRSGNAMMGIATYRSYSPNFREYLGIRLDSVLQPGVPYQIEFYYANGVNANPSIFNFGGQGTVLGVHFSDAPLAQFNSNTPIILPTDFETAAPVYSAGWQQLAFTFTPTRPVRYMTIGNFRNDGNTVVTQFATPGILRKAYYFFDDISVTRTLPLSGGVDALVANAASGQEDKLSFFDGMLRLHVHEPSLQRVYLAVMDIHGKIVYKKSDEVAGKAMYEVPLLPAGVYIAHLQTSKGSTSLRFLQH